MNENSKMTALKRLNVEKKNLDRIMLAGELTGFNVIPRESNNLVWDIEMEGPEDTPYGGGVYKFELRFPQEYPFKPPILQFVTKIWNPCIHEMGYHCLAILDIWKPVTHVADILLAVRYVLQEPLIDVIVNNQAAEQYKTEREKFNQKVETWKQLYA